VPFDFTYRVLMPVTLGAVSLAFIALGLYALIRRRPFVINSRWLIAIVVVTMSPQVIESLSWGFFDDRNLSSGLSFASLLLLLSTVILICYIALQMRGYMVFGTTQESFRDALLSSLSKLNLKAEETLSSIRLPSVPAELQVAVYGWIGTGQLRLRNGGRPGLLADVAAGMSTYFNSARVKMNMTTAAVYVILGILMSAMVVVMWVTF
jgi:hypothetical protein